MERCSNHRNFIHICFILRQIPWSRGHWDLLSIVPREIKFSCSRSDLSGRFSFHSWSQQIQRPFGAFCNVCQKITLWLKYWLFHWCAKRTEPPPRKPLELFECQSWFISLVKLNCYYILIPFDLIFKKISLFLMDELISWFLFNVCSIIYIDLFYSFAYKYLIPKC